MRFRFAFVTNFMFLLPGCAAVGMNRSDFPAAEEIIWLARKAREDTQDRATGIAAGGHAVLC